MNEGSQKDFTAYCGLFCQDCIPSKKRLFELIRELSFLASELHLDSYAELKTPNNPIFANYAIFESMLSELAWLECAAPCRLGGGKTECGIRDCAIARGYEGCWECAEMKECKRLMPLRAFHGRTIDENLDAIKECGIDDWSPKKGNHYPWS